MRTILVLLGLLAGLPLSAQARTAEGEVICPLDGTEISVSRPVSTNALGGTDSDFCQYASGEQPRQHDVATCPTCFYSATLSSFDGSLTDAQRRALQEMLRSAVPPSQSAAALEVWDRYQLAALCAGVLDQGALERGDILLTGAWTVRDRAVGFIPAVDGPLDAAVQLDEMDVLWSEIPDLQIQQMALFDLARLAHRGGMRARRDGYLVRLDQLPPVPPQLVEIRGKVLELLALEDRFLEKALEHYQEGLRRNEGSPEDQVYYRYLVVDIQRRLGQDKGLLDDLNVLLADPLLPEGIRPMAKGVKEILRGEQTSTP